MYYYYEHTQHCAPFHVINEFVHTIPAVHAACRARNHMRNNIGPPAFHSTPCAGSAPLVEEYPDC